MSGITMKTTQATPRQPAAKPKPRPLTAEERTKILADAYIKASEQRAKEPQKVHLGMGDRAFWNSPDTYRNMSNPGWWANPHTYMGHGR